MDPEIEQRFNKIDTRLDGMENHVSELLGQANTMSMLIKFIITPLLVIVGALVGIKLVIP